jgi:hypothetical protein
MFVILWAVLAIGLVGIVVLVASYRARPAIPPLHLPPGEKLPGTPLQRLVRWSLALGLLPLVAAVAVVASVGPVAYDEDDTLRLLGTVLLIASMAVLVVPMIVAGAWASRSDGRLDERDRAILSHAPTGQAAAMLVVLAVWIIALQESYRGAPGIPEAYLYLIFWSCLLVSLLVSNASILLAYRRS